MVRLKKKHCSSGQYILRKDNYMISAAFWSGRRVFLTGHTGFKGAWLSLLLARLGVRTTGFSLAPPTDPALFDIARADETLDDLRGDVTNLRALSSAMTAAAPEIVVHMAAQPLVKEGYADPTGTYLTNVMGTVNVLEAARHTPSIQAIVIVTTDKCYENREWTWGYRENDRLGGRDPYSNSKACAELTVSAYRQSFFARRDRPVAVVSARAGNVVGGGDFADNRIVPDAMRAFASRRPLQVRNPAAIRPWQHVLDPLHGYLTLAERACADNSLADEGWNFGPGHESEQSVETLIERLCAAWGPAAKWTADHAEHPHEAGILRLDTAKARQRLGWKPALSFDQMIEWTVEWHRAYATGANMDAVTGEQVEYFLSQCVAYPLANVVKADDLVPA
jgi:CDP-glucose 4,6-dehydratase